MRTFYGIKKSQTQTFDKDGKRLFITKLSTEPLTAVQVKTEKKDGYRAVQIGFGKKKRVTKPVSGHLKKAKLKTSRWFREIKLLKNDKVKTGDKITADQIFKVGDIVQVTGKTKGRGFAGVMKRWGFKGGPRTHGQSDRERAPGSIGQTTDPGRVWPGKKMPGHMGAKNKTVKGGKVVKIADDELWITGAVPGNKGGLVKVKKI